MSETVFHEKVTRLIHEELEPRGLALLVRELAGGRLRFLVKIANTGQVCHLLEYPPEDSNNGNGIVLSPDEANCRLPSS